MSSKKIIALNPDPEGFGNTPDELTSDMFESNLPVQHSHEYFADEALGLYVGVWDTSEMIEASGPYPCDEYMWLLEGEAEIKNNSSGAFEKARAGEAFIIPKGYDCQWHQKGYLRKYFFIYEDPDAEMPDAPSVEGIILPDLKNPCLPTTITEPFLSHDGTDTRQSIYYRDNSDRFFSGIWESGAFRSEVSPFPYHQLAVVTQGSITLTDDTNIEQTFSEGDAFFIPDGMMCSAHVSENVSLSFAVLCVKK